MQVDQLSASWLVIGMYSLEDLVTSSSVVLFVVSADLCHTGTSLGYSPTRCQPCSRGVGLGHISSCGIGARFGTLKPDTSELGARPQHCDLEQVTEPVAALVLSSVS